MSKIATILGTLVVGTLGLASCGGSEPEESRVLAPTTTIPPATTAEIVPVGNFLQTQPILISAGNFNTCALHQDGTISCWGASRPEEIHEFGAPGLILVPTKVPNISNAVAVSVGDFHICALHQDGTISCWGTNSYGELGNGKRELYSHSPIPTKVLNISDAVAISAGSAYTCALHEDGTVSCWGANWVGQLGNGNKEMRHTPTKVFGISNAIAISVELNRSDTLGSPAERSRTCALHEDGTVSCWGWNGFGQFGQLLGNGKTSDDYASFTQAFETTPNKVLNISDATAISVGGSHTCALRQDHTVSCWGSNRASQLGNGEEDSPTSTKVLDTSDAVAISAGAGHTCALHQDSTVSCWGSNSNGQLGNGSEENSRTPTKVPKISDAVAISAGDGHTCALHQDSTISCWGWNRFGQLGNGTISGTIVIPTKVLNISDATATSAGDRHVCALHQDGTVSCWGWNGNGQLGNGSEENSYTPIKVLNISDAVAISTGGSRSSSSYTCTLHQDGTVSCWGSNWYGELGNGKSGDDYSSFWQAFETTPAKVLNISNAVAISAGDRHACALHQDGTISCWGWNRYGQLGNGKSENDYSSWRQAFETTPAKVLNISNAVAISAGEAYTCALHQDGTISCWGSNLNGKLGNGKSENDYSSWRQAFETTPAKVLNISNAVAISAGDRHACALHQDGTISCWGAGGGGVLGDGRPYMADVFSDDGEGDIVIDYPDAPSGSSVPVSVEGTSDAIAISANYKHTCALHQDGTPSCWGTNWSDESVLGPKEYSLVPFQVTGLSDVTVILTGDRHTCALHQDGTISCWGWNRYGQLGNGNTELTLIPTKVLGSGFGAPS